MGAMWDLVEDWNAWLFKYARDAYPSGGNFIFTDAIPPHLIPSGPNAYGGAFIGFAVEKIFGIYVYPRTTQGTLVVGGDCTTVQTSHPGWPTASNKP